MFAVALYHRPQVTSNFLGSHVVYCLQKTRRYKVISIDNNHNSFPVALTRVSQIAKDTLPENPSEQDIDSTEIDSIKCDLTKVEEVRSVFEKYGKGGVWGVIHIAVRSILAKGEDITLNDI